eukprot:NODE_4625_length_1038_cov_113.702732_g4422_i0.p1 GENE.NODE_4625_length_1038_cov_113.702732_g4422_i0~~NODE_4625_length_1038_cov_113.702732_g4422_i0.p1  ORF type:complete len:289 (+),score=42.20 NODE_4625_length_1038_cov_113.702732_g4422_i0:90-956(+)
MEKGKEVIRYVPYGEAIAALSGCLNGRCLSINALASQSRWHDFFNEFWFLDDFVRANPGCFDVDERAQTVMLQKTDAEAEAEAVAILSCALLQRPLSVAELARTSCWTESVGRRWELLHFVNTHPQHFEYSGNEVILASGAIGPQSFPGTFQGAGSGGASSSDGFPTPSEIIWDQPAYQSPPPSVLSSEQPPPAPPPASPPIPSTDQLPASTVWRGRASPSLSSLKAELDTSSEHALPSHRAPSPPFPPLPSLDFPAVDPFQLEDELDALDARLEDFLAGVEHLVVAQ